MRLIDADALIGYLHTQFFYESRDRTRVYKAIQEQPTIKPERKTGKWVHEIDTGADMLKCSACECRVIELEYKTAVGLQGFTYCPYCGAEMEEDDGTDKG